MNESSLPSPQNENDGAVTVPADNRIDTGVTERLRVAVKEAGGNNAVAERAGVSLRNLGYYLAGRDMKTQVMVAIADACGVSVEWLASGRGEKVSLGRAAAWVTLTPGGDTKGDPITLKMMPKLPTLFETVDINILSLASDIIEDALRRENKKVRNIERLRAIIITYDLIKEGRDPVKFLAELGKPE